MGFNEEFAHAGGGWLLKNDIKLTREEAENNFLASLESESI